MCQGCFGAGDGAGCAVWWWRGGRHVWREAALVDRVVAASWPLAGAVDRGGRPRRGVATRAIELGASFLVHLVVSAWKAYERTFVTDALTFSAQATSRSVDTPKLVLGSSTGRSREAPTLATSEASRARQSSAPSSRPASSEESSRLPMSRGCWSARLILRDVASTSRRAIAGRRLARRRWQREGRGWRGPYAQPSAAPVSPWRVPGSGSLSFRRPIGRTRAGCLPSRCRAGSRYVRCPSSSPRRSQPCSHP